jgi:surfeit locus 1 family protein
MGFWVMTPLITPDGFTVLVNRGFVPVDRRDSATRAAGQIEGETTVSGLVRMTEPKGTLLRANDPAAGRWYSRDVAAIAKARDLNRVAPYFIDADATANPGGLPVGGLTVVSFYNHHLLYALTWFALALMLAVALGRVVRDRYLRK